MNDKSVIIMGSQSPALPRGRLMFALDATASRAPTWAIARELQAKMNGGEKGRRWPASRPIAAIYCDSSWSRRSMKHV